MKHTLLIITALMLIVGCSSEEKVTEKETVLSNKSFNKNGVYVLFPGDYTKSPDLGNEAINVSGVNAETYSLESSNGLYAITFLRFSVEPKGSLEMGMKGAVNAVSGTLKDYRYLDINGYSVLEYEYSSRKYGPTLDYFERSFKMDKYTMVNVKYMSTVAGDIEQGKKFLKSLSIEP